ncbi:MAG TPA: serine/threonine-protein kinase, partial [Kofleriaceae bacterium]|nr:serine/threonine-protein kinase [Kofleriaceae bacterium]
MLVNVGDVIAGRFEVERHVGAGGMGVVYRALDRDTSGAAALKVVRGTDRATNERFEREVTVLAELRHPNIVGYVTHGKTNDGALYLAMEWLEGEDLSTRLSVGTLSAAETVAVARQAAAALALAHQRGIIHRDIKPSNLMLVDNQPDRVKLLDFGIARLADIAPLTQTGMMIGTPLYMAPEQASGKSDIDVRADVFALGAVMFHCLTGRCPFPARTVAELVARLAAPTEAPRVRTFAPGTPLALDELVARMLAKDPAKRPRDAAAVHDALGPDVLAQQSMATAETGLVETPRPDVHDDAGARGQKALAEGRWADAKAAFTEALAARDSGMIRLGLAEALQWLGDCRGCIEQQEAAYALLRRTNDPMAALAAIQLGISQRKMMGNDTASRGWLARAARLLGNDVGPLHGYLWVANALDLDDPARAVELGGRALEAARKHNDRDLELIALAVQGYAMVVNGDLDGGMALIDESMAGIVGGEYERLGTIVPTTCMMVNACHRMADVRRMVEWCRGAEQFIDKYGAPFMFADCRAHYGSALMLTGRWDDAERELAKAMQAAPVETDYHAIARSQLADLRVRQGRLDEAAALLEELFDRACVRPIAAKIKFAAGRFTLPAGDADAAAP